MLKPLKNTLIRLAKTNNGFVTLECCLWIKDFIANKLTLLKEGFIEEVLEQGELKGYKIKQ